MSRAAQKLYAAQHFPAFRRSETSHQARTEKHLTSLTGQQKSVPASHRRKTAEPGNSHRHEAEETADFMPRSKRADGLHSVKQRKLQTVLNRLAAVTFPVPTEKQLP